MTEQPNLPPRYGRPIERDHALAQEGPAPDGWRTVALGDIADVVGGGTPSTKEPDNFDGDIPWLTPRDLSGAHDRYIERGERSLSLRGLDSSSAKLLPTGSVLLSTRAPIGYVALAKNQIATNQGFRSLLVRDGALPEYLYYWLKLNTEELERHASGSTFREISGSSLKEIRLRLPPLDEQRAIARVLGALDDKIELNRRMSATLEAMARALFKSWFVDFEPVRAKAAGRSSGLPPALDALFPASFEASELGEIPSGWGVRSLDGVAETVRGRSYRSAELAESDTALVTLKSFARGGGYRPEGLKPYTGKYKPAQIVGPGEVGHRLYRRHAGRRGDRPPGHSPGRPALHDTRRVAGHADHPSARRLCGAGTLPVLPHERAVVHPAHLRARVRHHGAASQQGGRTGVQVRAASVRRDALVHRTRRAGIQAHDGSIGGVGRHCCPTGYAVAAAGVGGSAGGSEVKLHATDV